MFLIVEFEGKEIGVVPASWTDGDSHVKWPPYKSSQRINSAVQRKEPPSDSWSVEPIVRVLYRNESFERVRQKLNRAEEESDLQTDDERGQKRKRKTPHKFSLESDSSEEDTSSSSTRTPSDTASLPLAPPKMSLNSGSTPENSPSSSQSDCSSPVLQSAGVSYRSPSTSTSTARSALVGPSGAGHQGSMAVIMSGITQLLTGQERIKEEVRELRRMVQQQATTEPLDVQAVVPLPEAIHLPISSVEEMETVDDLLRDINIFNAMTRHLQWFCASTVHDSVFRMLRETVSNTLAGNYNLTGQKSKRPFKPLQLMNVIHRCLVKNPTTKRTTKPDMEAEVQKWLRGARDRDGGRKERAQKQTVGLQNVTGSPDSTDSE